MVQWLRLCAPYAGGPGSIPGQGTRSHVLQLKIPHSATKTWSSQINIFEKKNCNLALGSQWEKRPKIVGYTDISGNTDPREAKKKKKKVKKKPKEQDKRL